MPATAASIRQQVQASLAQRIPGALEPRIVADRERVATGVEALDALLGGGVPVGAITELTGAECSGRTTAALGMVADLTRAGKVCAWIDVADALEPEAAAAAGVDLARLLWVRCGSKPERERSGAAVKITSPVLEAVSELGRPVGPGHCGGGSSHPRNESRGMPQALAGLLDQHPRSTMMKPVRREAGVGTPSMPNRPVEADGRHPLEKCQKGTSARARTVARREGVLGNPNGGPTRLRVVAEQTGTPRVGPRPDRQAVRDGGPLDQALRAADLLLQAGGFSALVLDLGSTAPEAAWRIPLATWFRFRAACERSRTSLVVLTRHTCAHSSAEAVVRLLPGEVVAEGKVMTGVRFVAELERKRFPGEPERMAKVLSIRKPPASERGRGYRQWNGTMNWMRRGRAGR